MVVSNEGMLVFCYGWPKIGRPWTQAFSKGVRRVQGQGSMGRGTL